MAIKLPSDSAPLVVLNLNRMGGHYLMPSLTSAAPPSLGRCRGLARPECGSAIWMRIRHL